MTCAVDLNRPQDGDFIRLLDGTTWTYTTGEGWTHTPGKDRPAHA